MPRYDFTSPRLYMDLPLSANQSVDLDRAQANYLLNVLRLRDGAMVLLFNGRDGEWHAQLAQAGRKKASLTLIEQTRAQPTPGSRNADIQYLFAPIKQARMEYMVQKAVEMGVSHIQPVLTQFTQVRKVNTERMEHYVVEAAEQCGILTLPGISEPVELMHAVDALAQDGRHLIFCDEGEGSQNPAMALADVPDTPLAVLIGPEGGFSEPERAMLRAASHVTPIPLGPRVLRADTAAVSALSIVQSTLGDWR